MSDTGKRTAVIGKSRKIASQLTFSMPLPLNFLSLGRWLYAIPFAIFGIFHFINGDQMTGMVPSYLPASIVWIYISGIGLLGASAAMLLGKYDKLAATLLAVELILFVLLIHLPMVMGGDQMAVGSLLKDIGLSGGALLYANYIAKDRSVVG